MDSKQIGVVLITKSPNQDAVVHDITSIHYLGSERFFLIDCGKNNLTSLTGMGAGPMLTKPEIDSIKDALDHYVLSRIVVTKP